MTVKSKPRTGAGWLWRHKTAAACGLAAVIAIVLGLLLHGTLAERARLREENEEQTKLIQALNEKLQAQDDAPQETAVTVSVASVEEQLQSLGELVTQQYVYTNAAKKSSSESWLWGLERPFSGKSILITYDGVIKAGIDLGRVTVEVDHEARTVCVTLPPSEITDNDIPQESIEIVEIKNGLFNSITVDNFNDFVIEQKPVMEQKAIDQGLLTQADEQAKAAVRALLCAMPGIGSGREDYRLILK